MALNLVTLGEVDAHVAETTPGAGVTPGGPITVQAVDTSAAGVYDETCYLDGSVDGIAWAELHTFTAAGQYVALNEPWQYLRMRQPGATGTATHRLTLKALVLVD